MRKKLGWLRLPGVMIGDDLYKRGYGQPLLKCVTKEQAQYIIKELHEGICGYHSCNIPREYYLKINNKRDKFINSHLGKNPNAGKFQFIKIARQNS